MKALFIGGGNMAQAILGGLVAQKLRPADFCVVEPAPQARASIAEFGIEVHAGMSDELLDCDAIVLAVKPQMMKTAISPLSGKLTSQVIVSIAAGVSTSSLAGWLGGEVKPYKNAIRAMPNTPALIRAGISGLYAAAGVNTTGKQIAEALLGAVGKTVWFDDEQMLDAVTAVSGSGPAYVFYFVEALEAAAIELGFDLETAHLFASQTFLGSAQLAASSDVSPATLRARVTSRRGTTEAAISSFDRHALKQAFIEGVKAACERSRELGRELEEFSAVVPDASRGTV
jgi:pyrroline-5-carboxylate reductase